MRRRAIDLPDDLDARLRHEADGRGLTVSELVSVAIEACLDRPLQRRKLLAAGAGANGREDVSRRIEEILESEFG